MIKSENIILLENLSQYDYDNKYYDFHNDYDCIKILFDDSEFLVLVFKNISSKEIVHLTFKNVSVTKIDFFNFNKVENLTIDNLYRGMGKIRNEFVEFGIEKRGYFYLEFDEGQKMEFWSCGLEVELNKNL